MKSVVSLSALPGNLRPVSPVRLALFCVSAFDLNLFKKIRLVLFNKGRGVSRPKRHTASVVKQVIVNSFIPGGNLSVFRYPLSSVFKCKFPKQLYLLLFFCPFVVVISNACVMRQNKQN